MFTVVDSVWAIVCIGLMASPEAVEFVKTDYGTAFYSRFVDTNASNVNLVMRRIMSGFYRIHRPEDIIIQFESEDISIKNS